VREVEKSLVLEVAFDSIHSSTRHKSGLAMRFPRISRIRIDKPALRPTEWRPQAMVT
jgi:DNA ligase-1